MKRFLILFVAVAALSLCSDVSACQPVRRALKATRSVASRAVRAPLRVAKAPLHVVKALRGSCR